MTFRYQFKFIHFYLKIQNDLSSTVTHSASVLLLVFSLFPLESDCISDCPIFTIAPVRLLK